MSITVTTNTSTVTANASTVTANAGTVTTNTSGNAAATIWSTLESSAVNGSQAAQTTSALVGGVTSSGSGQSANLSPVVASAQATLDSIVSNPALNLSRVLTSPSFAALVSALDGNANGLNGNNGWGSGTGSFGARSSASSDGSIVCIRARPYFRELIQCAELDG